MPPLEKFLNLYYQASPAGNKDQLAFMNQLVARYNRSLKVGVAQLQKEFGNGTKMKTFDVNKWFTTALNNPGSIKVSRAVLLYGLG